MHVMDGLLTETPLGIGLLAASAAATAIGTALGLQRMEHDDVPRVGLLSAAFFVISTIQVPVGVSTIHLMLTGLIGLVLGWAAFPAILVALGLQAAMCSLGGPLSLGLNTLTMAAPAVACHYLFRRSVATSSDATAFWSGSLCGATAPLLGSLLLAAILQIAGDAYVVPAQTQLIAHGVTAVVEGLIAGSAVVFLRKVRPELLAARAATAHVLEPTPE